MTSWHSDDDHWVVIQVVFALGLIAIVIGSIGASPTTRRLPGSSSRRRRLDWRILCELLIVVFRMNSSLTAIRANTAGLAPALPASGGTPDPGSARVEELASPATTSQVEGGAAAVPAASATMPSPEGWYDDSERPGQKRWRDGTAWGMKADEHPSAG